jgi:pyrroloquinoline quinone biosynthesis protein B
MIIRILGAAAGGGFPQLNCNCRLCAGVRAQAPDFRPRTQASVAVSSDGRRWVLLNASPDLRAQVAATPALAPDPASGPRHCPIAAVVLTNGDVDAVAGLLSLREAIAFDLLAAPPVLETLAANSIFNVLSPAVVTRRPLPYDVALPLGDGLTVRAYLVPGKTALYLETDAPDFGTRAGDTIGLEIADPTAGTRMHFIPSCASVDASLRERLAGAALVLFDGTLYADDEMIRQGLSEKTGARMGHLSMSGPAGSIAALEGLDIARRVFVHINNSNPVLDELGPEHASVTAAGWEIAYDGMEITL